jgi:predicted amidohydrolase YtcJ
LKDAGVAILNDRIVAIGHRDAILAEASETTRIVNFKQGAIVPGLIDAHTHLELSSYSLTYWHSISGFKKDEVLSAIGEIIEEDTERDWIVIQGTFGVELPSRAELDSIAPDRPVIVRQSMHVCTVNSEALRRSNITDEILAPPGVRLHRDETGRLTGIIEEGWDLLAWPEPDSPETEKALLRGLSDLFVKHGVTSVYEVAATATGIRCLKAMADSGHLPARIGVVYTVPPGHQPLTTPEAIAALGLSSGFGNEWLSILGIKIFLDGGRHGAFRSSDLGRPAREWGLLTRVPTVLTREIAVALETGLQVWIHAIGDLSQEIATNSIEEVVRTLRLHDHRTRVEHFGNEFYGIERLRRLLNVGGIPVPNPAFIYAEPSTPEQRIPPYTLKYPYRTLLSQGARPPGNSDTAGTQWFAANPWFGMWCMVKRVNRWGVAIDPWEAVSVYEALRAYTIDAAFACRAEHVKGSLEPGKFADIAVVDRNPFEIDPDDLKDICCLMTVVGGRVVHTSPRLSDCVAENFSFHW